MKIFKKDLKISKKSIIIASAIVLLIGIPAAYFLWNSQQENSKAWYNSSWLYRKAVSVTNPGSTLLNEDVLIVVDTASLITANKLQSDCDDLRFVDNDDSTTLTYWVEGGCNTSTTQIWVRIPSFPSGDYTIYMYYGNSSAVNAEASWSGNFLMLSDSSCNEGWSRDASFDGRFIYGSNTTTGGTTGGTSGVHNHGGNFSITSSADDMSSFEARITGSLCASSPHHHTVTGTAENGDSTPPYITTPVCTRNKLTTLNNQITITDGSIPTGWTRVSAYDAKFPMGGSAYGTTGGSTTHDHAISGVLANMDTTSYCSGASTMTIIGITSHEHYVSATQAGSSSNLPPYIQLPYIKAPTTLDSLNQQTIIMTTSIPPLGWSQYSYANNAFVMGASSVVTTLNGSSTHTHTFVTDIEADMQGVLSGTGTDYFVSQHGHTHTVSLTATNLPLYETVVFAKRKSSLSSTIGSTEETDSSSAPTNLLTEGQTNPTNVTDTAPEFSAIFNDPDTGDTGIYYEIEVNTTSGFDGNVMWDSNKTSMTVTAIGARSPNIPYAGQTLHREGSTYYWRIRFWDQNDTASAWSATAQFTMINQGSTDTWYNSGWLYRNALVVSNAGSTLTDEDVLIALDTASLISTGKLQNDCDDLRFTDSDNSTLLNYWIESGCNTTNTQIWVRIPSVPTGDKIIYMYYGNTAATAGELSWSGNFVAITDQSSCPTGWSRVTSLDGRFPQGSTSSGATGGSASHSHTYTANATHTHSPGTLATASAGAHTHTMVFSTSLTYPDPYIQGGMNASGTWSSTPVSTSGAHTHTITGATASAGTGSSATTNSTDSLPPFLDVLFCSPDVQQFSEVPANLVFLFDDTMTLAKYYSRFSALDSRFPRGSSTYGTTGGTTTHSHTYSTVLAHTHGVGTLATVSAGGHVHRVQFMGSSGGTYPYINGEQTAGAWLTNALSSAGAHTHTLSGSVASAGVASPSTQSENSLPPYLTMFYEKLTIAQEHIDPHTISMVTTSNPPLGWTRYSALDNKFAMGSTTYGTTGGATTHSHVYTDVPAHTHSVGTLVTASNGNHTHDLIRGSAGAATPYVSSYGTNPTWQGGTNNVETAGAHTHTFTGSTASSGTTNPSTDSISNIPPYMTIIYSQKKSSLEATTTNEELFNNAPTKPTDLFTEEQTNPIKVTDTTPEFSAIFNDLDTGNTAIYYQLVVSSADDLFTLSAPIPTMPEGMIWDSGKSSMTATSIGSRSPEISYAGDPLPLNGQTLYWRIRFWDQNDANGAWSDTSQFTMSGGPYAPSNLMVDGKLNPTVLSTAYPMFSALHTDPNSDNAIYYEIEVNSNSTFTGTIIWDTDKQAMTSTPSNTQSPDIIYAGTKLNNTGNTYYWRIRFWDTDDNVGSWSSTATFQDSFIQFRFEGLKLEGLQIN